MEGKWLGSIFADISFRLTYACTMWKANGWGASLQRGGEQMADLGRQQNYVWGGSKVMSLGMLDQHFVNLDGVAGIG